MIKVYDRKKRISIIYIAIVVLILVCVVMICVLTAALASNDTKTYAYLPNHSVYFYDVTGDYAWAHQAVDVLALGGVITGGGDHLYYPGNPITRADFIVMLDRAYNMSGAVESGKVPSKGTFIDVPSDAYYSDAVKSAKALGVTSGASGNHFWPQQHITRQDAMVFLKRTLDCTNIILKPTSLSKFSDHLQVADYAAEAVGALTGANIVDGVKGRLNPNANVTRAEIAVMLYRATHLTDNNGIAVFEKRSDIANVCIGAQIYSDAVIENYSPEKNYSELMCYTDIRQDDGVTYIMLEENQSIDHKASVSEGRLILNDTSPNAAPGATIAYQLADNCVAIDVTAPYHQMSNPVSTGGTYRHCYPSVVDGRVTIIYYTQE